jgi:hypothetical protein
MVDTPGLARNNSFGPMGLEVCETGAFQNSNVLNICKRSFALVGRSLSTA